VDAGFLFYYVLLIKSMFYNHLCMDINEKSKLSIGIGIGIGRNPDPERIIEHSAGQRPT